jgi:hypothetical protein
LPLTVETYRGVFYRLPNQLFAEYFGIKTSPDFLPLTGEKNRERNLARKSRVFYGVQGCNPCHTTLAQSVVCYTATPQRQKTWFSPPPQWMPWCGSVTLPEAIKRAFLGSSIQKIARYKQLLAQIDPQK